MKKNIIWIILLAFTTTSLGQLVVQKHAPIQTEYLNKSKRQKKAAWILLSGGAALFVIAAAIPEGDVTDEFNRYCMCHTNENDGIKGAFFLAGSASMLGSKLL